ncbi:MAG TPA: universal stress protein [Longimicrobiaceae bacterium]
MNGCILVATDGELRSLGAVRCASDLGRRLNLPVEVVSVCELASVFGYESTDLVAGVASEIAQRACEMRRSRVLEQLPPDVADRARVHVEVGSLASVIARLAEERDAHCVVVGRSVPSAVDRLLGDETAPRLMQAAHVPMLAVPAEYGELPSKALAAIDFTSYSLDAARTAATFLEPGGELHLVHAIAKESGVALPSAIRAEWARAMREELASRMDEVVRRLGQEFPHLRVVGHLAEGRPVPAVLRLTDELEAELLASGTNGYGFLGRLLMGSVATQLVRRARCLTLVAPPRGIVPTGEKGWRDIFQADALREDRPVVASQ